MRCFFFFFFFCVRLLFSVRREQILINDEILNYSLFAFDAVVIQMRHFLQYSFNLLLNDMRPGKQRESTVYGVNFYYTMHATRTRCPSVCDDWRQRKRWSRSHTTFYNRNRNKKNYVRTYHINESGVLCECGEMCVRECSQFVAELTAKGIWCRRLSHISLLLLLLSLSMYKNRFSFFAACFRCLACECYTYVLCIAWRKSEWFNENDEWDINVKQQKSYMHWASRYLLLVLLLCYGRRNLYSLCDFEVFGAIVFFFCFLDSI